MGERTKNGLKNREKGGKIRIKGGEAEREK
jgi:hypothetical protein